MGSVCLFVAVGSVEQVSSWVNPNLVLPKLLGSVLGCRACQEDWHLDLRLILNHICAVPKSVSNCRSHRPDFCVWGEGETHPSVPLELFTLHQGSETPGGQQCLNCSALKFPFLELLKVFLMHFFPCFVGQTKAARSVTVTLPQSCECLKGSWRSGRGCWQHLSQFVTPPQWHLLIPSSTPVSLEGCLTRGMLLL